MVSRLGPDASSEVAKGVQRDDPRDGGEVVAARRQPTAPRKASEEAKEGSTSSSPVRQLAAPDAGGGAHLH